MAVETSPAYQWFVKDFRSSTATRRMSFTERGVYREMLDQQWEDKTLPDDPEAVADLITVSDAQRVEVLAAWPVVRRKFATLEGGLIQNARLERCRRDWKAFKKVKSDAGKASAESRKASIGTAQPSRTATEQAPNRQPTAAEQTANNHRTGDQQPSNRPRTYIQQPPNRRSTAPEPALALASASALASATALREKEKSASLSPQALRDPFTDDGITRRAGDFTDRYQALYQQHRHGARYALKPSRDFTAAVTLCATWASDARLDQLAVIFLTTDHKFAEEGSRTIPQFLALASWCDGKLAEHEAKKSAS